MIPLIRDLVGEFFDAAARVQPGTWTYIFIAVVVIGVLSLRGFGSRSSY